jgi:sugar O-acyltransferase (sialic acid O-acetyltransferase NeuD family)
MKRLFIYGSGGFGQEVSDVAVRMNLYHDVSFIDDFNYDNVSIFHSTYVFDNLLPLGECLFTVAIGDIALRNSLIERIEQHGGEFAVLIDPTAVVSPSATFSEGVIVCQLAFIGPNVKIGKFGIVNSGAIVGHDIVVGNNSVVSSGAKIGGNTVISESVYLGMGSVVKEGLKLDRRSVLGMGAVLHSDLDSYMLAIGNPARVIRRIDDDFKILG